jgi:uncharacterized protein YceK
MKNIVLATLVSGAIALTSGCASILNSDTQQVNLATSNGKEITVKVDGQEFQAPGIATLTRVNADKIVMTDAKGCTKQTLAPKKVDNMFWLNILSGGSFGSSTDYSTEKMWGYQDRIVVTCAN